MSINIRFIFYMILCSSIALADFHYHYLDRVRLSLSVVIYPLYYVVNVPVNAAGWLSKFLTTHHNLLIENERLQKEHFMLNAKLQRFEVLEQENHRLRELLESSSRPQNKVLIAELIAVGLQPFRRQIVINKGRRDDAYDGQPIADATGIMGQIVHAGPFSSTVLLITDPNHAMPVQVNRNGLRGIAIGLGQNDRLRLQYLPHNSDIHVGDLIISSGLGQRFPPGYPVGQVEKITPDPSKSFADIIVKPSAELDRSREVLMIWPYDYIERGISRTR